MPKANALFPVASVSGKTVGEYGNGGATSTGRTEYIWLPTDDGSAIPIGMFRSNKFYAIHSDHLGTPRLIKDDAAKPTWQWAYSAFGDNKPTGILKATTNPNSAITNLPVLLNATNPAVVMNARFAGQYWDSETGLAYNWNRYYQANQGRYTQPDLIGLAGGSNRTLYGNANAVSFTDPDGKIALPAAATAAGLAGAIYLTTPQGQQALQSIAKDIGGAWSKLTSSMLSKPARPPADEASAQGEHDWYKSICDDKKAPTGDRCLDILNEANRHLSCAKAMSDWDDRWNPGRHAADIGIRSRTGLKLLKEYEQCKKDCP